MGDFFNSIFGGGDEDEALQQGTTEAESSVSTQEKKAKAVRSALYKTGGGSSGAELLSGEVKKRDTLLGN